MVVLGNVQGVSRPPVSRILIGFVNHGKVLPNRQIKS